MREGFRVTLFRMSPNIYQTQRPGVRNKNVHATPSRGGRHESGPFPFTPNGILCRINGVKSFECMRPCGAGRRRADVAPNPAPPLVPFLFPGWKSKGQEIPHPSSPAGTAAAECPGEEEPPAWEGRAAQISQRAPSPKGCGQGRKQAMSSGGTG